MRDFLKPFPNRGCEDTGFWVSGSLREIAARFFFDRVFLTKHRPGKPLRPAGFPEMKKAITFSNNDLLINTLQ
jgi:hypothetical protein